MTEHQPQISVVVPTRNRASTLPQLLQALGHQEDVEYEVIVVDDASHDETAALLEVWGAPQRRVIRLEQNMGSYAARNRGWRAASGDIIAFTDDDCIPHPRWLKALVCALRHPHAVAAQGVTLPRSGRITPFTHQIKHTRLGPPYRTCNIAYPRWVLEHLGGFDDTFPWYADNLLGLWARQLGEIILAPDAIVDHPPRSREWRDRTTWRRRFLADARYRRELHVLGVEPITLPPRSLPVVLWVVRPLVKQSWAHLRYLLTHPAGYLRQMSPMVGEKWELLVAMRQYGRDHDLVGKDGNIQFSPLPEHPLVSVVVVTHDRPSLLAGALAAIAGQAWPEVEVVVVDHGPSALTEQVAREFGSHYLPVEGGTLAEARQRGVDASQGSIVAFTDDDCLPQPGWLDAMVATFRRHPELWGVQGRTDAEVGPIGCHTVRAPGPNGLYQTCNIAYRSEALSRAGGFDPEFVGWFEDTALAARVLEHGPIGFSAGAAVLHRARPRSRFDRARWRAVLRDERRLWQHYPALYRRVRGRHFLVAVMTRWLAGSPLKTLFRELPHAGRQPRAFLRLLVMLAQERRDLVLALLDVMRE